MSTPHRPNRALNSALFLTAALLSCGSLSAQTYWTGVSGSGLNWSTAGNWYWGVTPGSFDSVVFDFSRGGGMSATQGLVNNYVDSSMTISTLGYDVTNAYYTTQINPGVTLSVVPQGGARTTRLTTQWLAPMAP